MHARHFFFLFIITTFLACQAQQNTDLPAVENQYAIIPQPVELKPKTGVFPITTNTQIAITDPSLQAIATYIKQHIPALAKAKITTNNAANTNTNIIGFQLNTDLQNDEGYTLFVMPKKVLIQAKNAAGAFYAVQTLRQLMQENNLPAVEIKDEPRFAYRGMHLDVSRHFFPVADIKDFIDQLAYHKINRFHWHLTDDQGWRIEIKKYPKLAEIAAFRKETLIGHYSDQPHQFDGKKYGGFYTQEEIKEVVNYAQERFITIIPEIEMPGHSQAVLAAYPELGCTDGPFETATKWGVFDNVFCPKEETFAFLENVLTEVMDLFPSEYIHIGGDECPKTRWKESPFCQDLMKKEGLKDEHELQSYFIRRMERFLNEKGRNIIGWDEILEGGLAPNASVMSWRGEQGGIEAAKQGHDVVMTPTTYCYFDYYQSQTEGEPLAIGGFLPLKKVYGYDPVPQELSAKEAKHILGVQANLWTEYIPTVQQLQYMQFPRACALAEIAWTPLARKDYTDFTKRLLPHLKRLETMGIQPANHLFDVQANIRTGEGEGVVIELLKETTNGTIHYTLDGTKPTANSAIYADEIKIDKSLTIKALTFEGGQKIGNGIEETFNFHKATGKRITFTEKAHPKYSGNGDGSVINAVFGSSERYGGSEWLGFDGKDAECVINFGEKTDFNSVTMRFYKGEGQWIYLPKKVEIWASDDGENYTSIAKKTTIEGDDKLVTITLPTAAKSGHFLKVKATRFGLIPDGAQGAGNEAWLFLDEVVVD